MREREIMCLMCLHLFVKKYFVNYELIGVLCVYENVTKVGEVT